MIAEFQSYFVALQIMHKSTTFIKHTYVDTAEIISKLDVCRIPKLQEYNVHKAHTVTQFLNHDSDILSQSHMALFSSVASSPKGVS